jgi:glutathione S-transferase
VIRLPAEQRDMAAVAKSVAATGPLLDLLEQHLSASAFVAGARITMADIPLACEIHRWWGLPPDITHRPAYPHIERWYAGMRARPASRGVLDLPLS